MNNTTPSSKMQTSKTGIGQWPSSLMNSTNNVKPAFLKTMKKYEYIWKRHLSRSNVENHRNQLNLIYAPPTNTASYRAGLKQRELQLKKVKKMSVSGVTSLAVAKWDFPAVFVPRNDGSLWSRVDYRRLNAVSDLNSYPIPGWLSALIF